MFVAWTLFSSRVVVVGRRRREKDVMIKTAQALLHALQACPEKEK